MAVQTTFLEPWAADIKFTLKQDLITILKSSVVSWKKNVQPCLKDLLQKGIKIIINLCHGKIAILKPLAEGKIKEDTVLIYCQILPASYHKEMYEYIINIECLQDHHFPDFNILTNISLAPLVPMKQ